MSEQEPRGYRAPRRWPGGRRPQWPRPGRPDPGPRPEFEHLPATSSWSGDEPPSLTHRPGQSFRWTWLAVTVVMVFGIPALIVGLALLAGERVESPFEEPVEAAPDEPGAGAPTGPTYAPPPPASATVLAASWRPGDETYLMDLGDSGIGFRTPDYWGCARMASAVSGAEQREGYVRWVCGDDGGTFPTKPRHDPGSILRLELLPCEGGACSVATRADAEADGGPLGARVDSRLDDRTWTWTGEATDDGLLPRGLLRTVDLDDDGGYEAVLSVAIFASPPDEEAAGKVLRDLYDHAW